MLSIQSSIIAAADWLQQLQSGTLAVAIATLAIAVIGAAMLAGRIDIRRGAQIILGCFLLFGASAIANGLNAMLRGTAETTLAETAPTPIATPVTPSVNPFDPYAGAATPPHH